MCRTLWMTSTAILLALVLCLSIKPCHVHAQVPPDPGLPGPYDVAGVTFTTNNPDTGSDLETDIYYPSGDGMSVDPGEAPYPTLVFARGFMAFPTSYSGWGEHLASWGYIVAFPDFPSEDREVRVSDIQHLLSYLEAENVNSDSLLFQSIDVDRFGQAGHSAGGLSSMIVAARDERIKAVVALDPAGSPSDGWDYEAEAPAITAPIAVIGAPSQFCNNSAAYDEWYPHVGAAHKAKFVIANGSHCDFMDTDEDLQVQLCSLLCGPFSQERLELAKRYATAWFNYYLHYDPDYHTYLYGEEADVDVQADRIARDVQTAPRDVTAIGRLDAVELHWTFYDHPMVVGYNVYRSQLTGDYPSAPAAQLGPQSVYTDTTVVAGEAYYYVLRSRDAAGNEHQLSDEVSAVAGCPPPTAGFDARPTDCCVPLTVVFTDTSIADISFVPTNTIEGWYWQFGDGVGSSSDQNPIHTYDEPGVYTVTLTVTDSQGSSDTDMQPSYIKSNPWPAASFDASPTDCCVPLAVVFTDTSMVDASLVPTNTIESWYWQFGDGVGNSSDQNPTYTYDEPGVYTVTLTVTDSHGCSDKAVQPSYIRSNPWPAASFDASPADPYATLTVVFTDTSMVGVSIVPTNTIEGWNWQFGDGIGSSADQNPTYTYDEPGVYTVTLTVTDSHGCSDTVVQASHISSSPPPTAGFEARPTDCCIPLTVVFTDTSIADTSLVPTNTIEGWYWQFGDGTGGSSKQNPIHTYDEPGVYTVTLTVTDSHGCSDTAVQPSYIKSNPWPAASFDASPADPCAILTVVFTDTSIADTSVVPTNTVESWNWQFGDGAASSTDQDPIYTYERPGVYTVTLTVTDSHGCSDHATDVVQVEREFESFVYLPLIVRGERAEDPESGSTIQRGQPPRIEAVLDVVMDLLRRLFTGPSRSGDHAP